MSENLHIAITGDNQGFINALNGARAGVRATAREVENSGGSIEQMFNRIKTAAAGALAGFSAKAFIQQVVQIRGEFQQLEAAFTTLLGSAEKANKMMEDMTHLAATTPFDLKGVASGAQQLLAYGVAADEITDTLTRLGDIAAGLSLPLNDLVYLYGTTLTQGRMYTMDLRQFMGRGIPMAEELAKQFGVTKDKVGELVTEGKVGAEEFKKAIKSMSDEGGKFGGLMDMQSRTITGQISNIEDNLDMMFNNIGKQSEGIINDALSGVGTLIDNYETVGKVLLGLVATYGAYKAAVMTVTAMQGLQAAGVGALTVAETAHYGWIVLVEKAQKLLNATMLNNPYVLVATAIAGVVAVMMTMKSQEDLVNEATEQYNREKEEAIKKEREHAAEIDKLCSVAGDESLSTDTRKAALVRLIQQYPAVFKKYKTEIEMLGHIRDIKLEIAELDGQKSIQKPKNELASVEKRIQELEQKTRTETFTGHNGSAYTREVSARTKEDEAELVFLRRRRAELLKQVKKDAADTYLKDLTGVSNADLRKQVNERKNLLAKMEVDGRRYGKVRVGGAQGTYNKDELQGQLTLLQAEQTRRKQIISDGSKDFTAEARKAYNKEKKALDNLRSLTDPKKRAASSLTVDVGGKKKKISELTSTEYEDAVEKQQKSVDEAAKKLKGLAGKSIASESSAAKAAKQEERDASEAAQRAERLREETQKWDEETAKQSLEALYAQEEARIAAIADGGEREREERELQYQKDKDQIDQQERDFRKQNYEHNKTVFENSAKGNKNKYAGTIEGTALTADQQAQVDARRRKVEEDYTRWQLEETKERVKAERDAMDEYLKEYGTAAEQRYAIAREYAAKIKAVEESSGSTEAKKWRVRSLERERDDKLSGMNARNLATSIDWATAFKGVGNVLSDIAKETLGKVDEYMKTDEFRKLSAENKKTYADLRSQLAQETGGNATSPFNFGIWDTIAKQAKAYQESVKDVMEKEEAHAEALKELELAEKEYADATDETSRQLAAAYVNTAKSTVESTGKDLDTAKDKSGEAKNDLTDSTERAVNGLDNFTQALQEVSSGSLKGFADGVVKLAQSIGGKESSGLAGLGKIGGIVGAILSIIDALGDDPAKFFDDLFAKITNTVETLLSQLFTDVLPTILQGIGTLIGGIIEGIGQMFGADEGWMYGSNKKEVQEYTEKLQRSNDALKESIDDLKESIDDSAGTKAVQSYEEAYKAQQTVIANAANQLAANMGMHDKHKSNRHYWNNSGEFGDGGYGYGLINAILENYRKKNPGTETAIGRVGSLQDMYKLTPEQMNEIRTQNAELWNDIISVGKYDMSEYWNAYADLADSLNDLTEQINENLTQTTFDSLHDNFVSTIMDMDKEASDFADDFAEMMAKAFVNAQVGNLMDSQLQSFYDSWAVKMKNGTLTKEDIGRMRSEYMELANQALQIRNTMEEVTGYTGNAEQSASANGASSISYDQASQFIGLVTAGNIVRQNISDNIARGIVSLSSLTATATAANTTLSEMRNLMIYNNSYLEDILKVEKSFYNDFVDKMDMNNRYLKEMK